MRLPPEQLRAPRCYFLRDVFHRFSPPTVTGHRPTTEAGLTVWKRHLLNLLTVCLPVCLSVQTMHINLAFCDCDTVSTLKPKTMARLQSFNQRGPFASAHFRGFEDTRLSSRSNKVGLAGFKTFPAWSGILSPRRGRHKVTPGNQKQPKESVALVSASKNVCSVAAGWIDLTVT